MTEQPDLLNLQIEPLVKNVLDSSIRKHGEKFNSNHEAYAVILEEVEEVHHEFQMLKNHLCSMWWVIKKDKKVEEGLLEAIRERGINLITEALQVTAMCDKYENSFKEV